MNYFVQALDAKHLIQKLDIPKVIIIGHSMGGKVAMTMALSFPELVEKIIVVDSSPAPSISDEDIQRYLKTKIEMDLSKMRNKKDAEKMMMNTVNVSAGYLAFIDLFYFVLYPLYYIHVELELNNSLSTNNVWPE